MKQTRRTIVFDPNLGTKKSAFCNRSFFAISMTVFTLSFASDGNAASTAYQIGPPTGDQPRVINPRRSSISSGNLPVFSSSPNRMQEFLDTKPNEEETTLNGQDFQREIQSLQDSVKSLTKNNTRMLLQKSVPYCRSGLFGRPIKTPCWQRKINHGMKNRRY